MNVNLLAVVTPPYIYQSCFTWNTLWKRSFTLGEFKDVNMKFSGLSNVS